MKKEDSSLGQQPKPEETSDAKKEKMIAFRNLTANEILQTETTYLNSLRLLCKDFLTPLREASVSDSKAILKKEELVKIFSSIELIVNVNEELLKGLNSRISDWSNTQCIGDVFLKLAPFLKLYTQYSSNYEDAMKTFQQCLNSNPQFRKFLQDMPYQEDGSRLELGAYLIMPIQRIPRYIMLLGDMIKNTWPDHPDYATLCSALDKVKEVANVVNEGVRRAENQQKVYDISVHLEGYAGKTLFEPRRVFVREGSLGCIPLQGGKQYTAMVILFNDMLLLTRRMSERKGYFRCRESVKLSKLWLFDFPDVDKIKHAFQLVMPHCTYVLYAETLVEKNEWMDDITKKINERVELFATLANQRQVAQKTFMLQPLSKKVDTCVFTAVKAEDLILSSSESEDDALDLGSSAPVRSKKDKHRFASLRKKEGSSLLDMLEARSSRDKDKDEAANKKADMKRFSSVGRKEGKSIFDTFTKKDKSKKTVKDIFRSPVRSDASGDGAGDTFPLGTTPTSASNSGSGGSRTIRTSAHWQTARTSVQMKTLPTMGGWRTGKTKAVSRDTTPHVRSTDDDMDTAQLAVSFSMPQVAEQSSLLLQSQADSVDDSASVQIGSRKSAKLSSSLHMLEDDRVRKGSPAVPRLEVTALHPSIHVSTPNVVGEAADKTMDEPAGEATPGATPPASGDTTHGTQAEQTDRSQPSSAPSTPKGARKPPAADSGKAKTSKKTPRSSRPTSPREGDDPKSARRRSESRGAACSAEREGGKAASRAASPPADFGASGRSAFTSPRVRPSSSSDDATRAPRTKTPHSGSGSGKKAPRESRRSRGPRNGKGRSVEAGASQDSLCEAVARPPVSKPLAGTDSPHSDSAWASASASACIDLKSPHSVDVLADLKSPRCADVLLDGSAETPVDPTAETTVDPTAETPVEPKLPRSAAPMDVKSPRDTDGADSPRTEGLAEGHPPAPMCAAPLAPATVLQLRAVPSIQVDASAASEGETEPAAPTDASKGGADTDVPGGNASTVCTRDSHAEEANQPAAAEVECAAADTVEESAEAAEAAASGATQFLSASPQDMPAPAEAPALSAHRPATPSSGAADADGRCVLPIPPPLPATLLSPGREAACKAGKDAADISLQVRALSQKRVKRRLAVNALTQPSKEGHLHVQATAPGKASQKWRKRWFVLKMGFLLYYRTPEDSEPLGAAPLLGATVFAISDVARRAGAFEFAVQEAGAPPLVLQAASDLERSAWIGLCKAASKEAERVTSSSLPMLISLLFWETSPGVPAQASKLLMGFLGSTSNRLELEQFFGFGGMADFVYVLSCSDARLTHAALTALSRFLSVKADSDTLRTFFELDGLPILCSMLYSHNRDLQGAALRLLSNVTASQCEFAWTAGTQLIMDWLTPDQAAATRLPASIVLHNLTSVPAIRPQFQLPGPLACIKAAVEELALQPDAPSQSDQAILGHLVAALTHITLGLTGQPDLPGCVDFLLAMATQTRHAHAQQTLLASLESVAQADKAVAGVLADARPISALLAVFRATKDGAAQASLCGILAVLSRDRWMVSQFDDAVAAQLVGLLAARDTRLVRNSLAVLVNLAVNDKTRRTVHAQGGFRHVVRCLMQADEGVKDQALRLLCNTLVADVYKDAFGKSGGIAFVIPLLWSANASIRNHAAWVVENICLPADKYMMEAVFEGGGVPPLVRMLMLDHAAGSPMHALRVLAVLAQQRQNRALISTSGVLQKLGPFLARTAAAGMQETAVGLVCNMLVDDKIKRDYYAEFGVVHLEAAVDSPLDDVREKGLRALANLCFEDPNISKAVAGMALYSRAAALAGDRAGPVAAAAAAFVETVAAATSASGKKAAAAVPRPPPFRPLYLPSCTDID